MTASWYTETIFACLLALVSFSDGSEFPKTCLGEINVVAETAYGKVRGFVETAGDFTLIKYLGIPYAKPPTGSLRFKQPEPPSPWSDVKKTTKFGAQCPQVSMPGYNDASQPMNEDCLFINVFIPLETKSAEELAVMVWIYGGGYIIGSAKDYDVTSLVGKGVVVVTFNHRIDVLGYMSTEDDAIPGNFGLMDQILALKWVKQNIANFGGDPNRVTIFGESSGSASVSLLMLSPLANGLFERGIMQSGTCLSPWAVGHPATRLSHKLLARLMGGLVGCTQDDSDQFLLCMQSVDAMKLLSSSHYLFNTFGIGMIIVPRINDSFGVLPDLPIRLLEKGQYNHVDTIRGYATHEKSTVIENPHNGVTQKQFQIEMKRVLTPYSISNEDIFMNHIQDIYLGNITDRILALEKLSAFVTDFTYVGPTIAEAQFDAKWAPEKKNYIYEFNYRPSYSELPSWVTAGHGQELGFVFGFETSPFFKRNVLNQNDWRIADQLLTMWTNFAKTGNPTSSLPHGVVEWEQFTHDSQRLLKINTVSSSVLFGLPHAVELFADILQKA